MERQRIISWEEVECERLLQAALGMRTNAESLGDVANAMRGERWVPTGPHDAVVILQSNPAYGAYLHALGRWLDMFRWLNG